MTIQEYHIVSLLKEDKYLKVYWVKKQNSDKNFILKLFDKSLINDGFVERFNFWSKKLLTLDHPNLVKYVDFINQNGQYGYVIEDFNFSPLWDVYREMEPSFDLIKKIFSQILRSVNYAHSLGITNGEFECEKIHFDGLSLWIEDFGIKNILFETPQLIIRKEEIDHYCCFSPEQFSKCSFDTSIDIYSLGVILFALSEGNIPFSDAKSYEEIEQKIQQTDFLVPSEHNPFSEFIIKATQHDINKRYASLRQWLDQWDALTVPNQQKDDQEPETILASDEIKIEDEEIDITKEKLRNKQRYAILVILAVFIILFALRLLAKDFFYNPRSYSIYTGKQVENVNIISHNGHVYDLLAVTPEKYIFNFRMDIDSGEVLHSNVVEFPYGNFSEACLVHGNIYVIGTNNNNKQFFFPVLYIIKSSSYEPYLNTNELGKYIDIFNQKDKTFILKQSTKDFINHHFYVYIDVRDFFLKLEREIKVADIQNEAQEAKAFVLLNDVFVVEIYDYLDKKIKLVAIDTAGNSLWTETFASDSISGFTKWRNLFVKEDNIFLATLNKKGHRTILTVIQFNLQGKIVKKLDVRLNNIIKSLDKVIIEDDKIIFSVFTQWGYSMIYVGNYNSSKLIFKKRIGFVDNIHITDLSLIDEQDLLVAGTVKYNFNLDTTERGFIYLTRFNLDNGRQKDIPFKSKYFIPDVQY